ncbi:MAG: hypothetical protein IT384_03770 [Deltaproteobacteria bacterium]|nr:hypothetical protein [Deltaproteobacteria bacterium]
MEILRAIRDELSRLRGDTNARLDELRADTNTRLDFLSNGQARLATEIASLRGEVHDLRGDLTDLRGVVERNGERFEHFLATEATSSAISRLG